MKTWADIRDLGERVLDDGGCSSNYIAEAADCALSLIKTMEPDRHGSLELGNAIAAMLDAESCGMCNWQAVARGARVLADPKLRPYWNVWDKDYDPKTEGARKLAEGWP